MTTETQQVDPVDLQKILAKHLPLYRRRKPAYQALMLDSLRELWLGHHQSLLDVGGGTGVIAEAIAELFPVDQVQAVDVVDRFCPSLSVRTQSYDGKTLPFKNAAFHAASLNNVMHHVPVEARAGLLREIRRVVNGPIYIKDHETCGKVDDLRLTVLDALGNVPFGGMVSAHYLGRNEWEQLARDSGYHIGARAKPMPYRKGVFEMIFPNRLEVAMRFDPA